MELSNIKGVGASRLAILNEMGIYDVDDLLSYYPRKYIEYEQLNDLSDCEDGHFYSFKAEVVSSIATFRSRGGKHYCKCQLSVNGMLFSAIWFNNRFVDKNISENKEYVFSGRVKIDDDELTFFNPSYKQTGDSVNLISIYTLPNEISQNIFSSIIMSALKCVVVESIISGETALIDINYALKLIHFPKSYAEVNIAKSRLATEELVQLMLAVKFVKQSQVDALAVRFSEYDAIDKFINKLPFELTVGQRCAIDSIVEKLQSGSSLNCMLQGDVGCGKTVVAFALMYLAVANGYQAVIMAPTEVLASQHYKTALKFFGKSEGVCYLTNLTKAERENVKNQISLGNAQIIIGTHVAFSDDIIYKNLGFIVTDEQHRFGVQQRRKLIDKGRPHCLVMSATPIPRTLALVMYGDLDVVTIDTKPVGRQPILTSIVPIAKYENMMKYIADSVRGAQQAYIVCPMIDMCSVDSELYAVNTLYDELKRGVFADISIAKMHGRMTSEDRNEVMQKFADGEVRALIATTVIEVGVDNPNANIIAILNADRFGLATLHQLRGRVGRGGGESRCFLYAATKGDTASRRLKIMTESGDGFYIAEKDFELRGGGEFFGDSQSGFAMGVLRKLKPDGATAMRAREIVQKLEIDKSYFIKAASKKYADIVKITL